MSAHVCVQCAITTDAPGECARCGDVLLDTSRDDVRELLADIDDRRRRAHEQRMLWLSIACAFVVAIALWSIPGYWNARIHYFALPMLLDQLLLIGLLSAGLATLTKRLLPSRPRFNLH